MALKISSEFQKNQNECWTIDRLFAEENFAQAPPSVPIRVAVKVYVEKIRDLNDQTLVLL